MRNSLARAACLLLALAACSLPANARADEPYPKLPPPVVRPHAPLAVSPNRPKPAEQYRRLEQDVRSLAHLASWGPGLDPNSSSGVFREGGEKPKGGDAEAAQAAHDLVTAGPDVIPVLLAHLDDETPTPQVLTHPESFGGMEACSEIDVNPALEDEVAALHAVFPGRDVLDPDARIPEVWIDRHVVTVGDCCFALLGTITNRNYESVHYRGTNITVVNSPTRDPRIAAVVRAEWAGKDVRVELVRRLMADFHTTRGGDFHTRDGSRQAGAVRLLGRYFPAEAEAVLVARLDALTLSPEPEQAPADNEANNLDIGEFLQACGEAGRPNLRAALARVALRTQDSSEFTTAMQGLRGERGEPFLARFKAFLARPDLEDTSIYNLLLEVGRRWPEQAPALLRGQLTRGSSGQRVVAELGYREGVPLTAADWRPLLDVKEKAVLWQGVGRTDPLERLRLCDLTALLIVRQRKELTFDSFGDERARDAQLAVIRRVLDGEAKR